VGKLPDNFDDWRLPWTEAEFDSDKAARLVFNARKGEERAKERLESEVASKDAEIAQLKTDLDAEKARKTGADADGQAEILRLKQENEELKAKAEKPTADNAKEIERLNDVIDLVEKGLPKALALRVQGEDTEARLEDAKGLAEAAGIDFGGDGDNGGEAEPKGGNPDRQPPGQRPVSGLRTGFEGRQPIETASDPKKASVSLPPLF
jgi:hypothetical protein